LIPICSTILRHSGTKVKDALHSFSDGGRSFPVAIEATDGTANTSSKEVERKLPRRSLGEGGGHLSTRATKAPNNRANAGHISQS